MTDAVDADELLRRIRAARDWALKEEQALDERAKEVELSEQLDFTFQSRTYHAVRVVLDEIIEPGKHARDKR
ncbi:hypothetical protein [Streptomyces sp. V1I6]|uniref:hypothetical protein n=1 Tax=Streptomyces sp. V1I6 TaxID=3042273 RepID=UPI0027D84498|nr:hypothetical protein [Streptomyces sp. V1I6]